MARTNSYQPRGVADRAKTYGNAATTVDQVLEQLRVLQSELESGSGKGQAFAKYTSSMTLRPKVEQFAGVRDQRTIRSHCDTVSWIALSQNFGLNA